MPVIDTPVESILVEINAESREVTICTFPKLQITPLDAYLYEILAPSYSIFVMSHDPTPNLLGIQHPHPRRFISIWRWQSRNSRLGMPVQIQSASLVKDAPPL